MADLATLQRRFFAYVTGRVAVDGGVDRLIGSGNLDIYANMYESRLHDTLVDDYPKLRRALGEAAFAARAAAYLRAHPPRSFTLRDAGLDLPRYLRGDGEAPAWAADLAALERARVEVFDGPEARPLTQDEVLGLDAALPELVVRWVPSSEVVALGWDVDELWSAIEDATEDATEDGTEDATEDGQPRPPPAPDPRVVLVWRRDVAVLHRTLDPDEATLAPALVGGLRFAELCDRLAELHGDEASPRAAELLLRWLGAAALVATLEPSA